MKRLSINELATPSPARERVGVRAMQHPLLTTRARRA
jgi:hypothetical protein